MLTRFRHTVRGFFWAARWRDIWVLRGEVRRLETRCARLEDAVRELNPGLNL